MTNKDNQNLDNQIPYQRIEGTQSGVSVRDSILPFYTKEQQAKAQDKPEGITALYVRLSQDDDRSYGQPFFI